MVAYVCSPSIWQANAEGLGYKVGPVSIPFLPKNNFMSDLF